MLLLLGPLGLNSAALSTAGIKILPMEMTML